MDTKDPSDKLLWMANTCQYLFKSDINAGSLAAATLAQWLKAVDPSVFEYK